MTNHAAISELSPTPTATLDRVPERMSVKYYLDQPEGLNPESLIPVFHRWIQRKMLAGLLIDVADYTHVHHGPGLMIVAHEGHYRLEDTDGRLGMEWAAKRGLEASFSERVHDVFRKALHACLVLESEQNLERSFRFLTNHCLFRIQDRLSAPNNEQTFQAVKPHLAAVLAQLYPGVTFRLERDSAPKECFTVRIHLEAAPELARLVQRAGG